MDGAGDIDTAYQELQAYTLGRRDEEFLHQYVVDAWAAQTAHADTKPIALTFALMGLYLHAEHGWTGRQVQRGHMALALNKPAWPALHIPERRGTMTPGTVMCAAEGDARDAAIRAWARDVWAAYAEMNKPRLHTWLQAHGLHCDRPLLSSKL